MNSSEEKDIIEQVRNGSVQAFSKLVNGYKNYAFTLAFRILKNKDDAEEIAQDSFVKAYQQLNTFKGQSKFSTWLYTIVYRNSISFLRKNKLKIADIDGRMLNNIGDDTAEFEDLSKEEEQEYYVKKAIGNLSDQDAALITLFYFEENSIEDIELVTGLSKSNVKVKLHRIRKKLYNELEFLLKSELKSIL